MSVIVPVVNAAQWKSEIFLTAHLKMFQFPFFPEKNYVGEVRESRLLTGVVECFLGTSPIGYVLSTECKGKEPSCWGLPILLVCYFKLVRLASSWSGFFGITISREV